MLHFVQIKPDAFAKQMILFIRELGYAEIIQ